MSEPGAETIMKQELDINGIIGNPIELDGGRRLLVRRTILDGLLDVDDLKANAPFKVEDPIDGTDRIPDLAWLEDMMRQGRIRILSPVARKDPACDPFAELDHEEVLKIDPYAGIKRALVRRVGEQGITPNDPELGSAIRKFWIDLEPEVARIALERADRKPMKRPETSTVRTWMREVDPLEATLLDMMSRSGQGARKSSLEPEVIDILEEKVDWFYENSGRRIVDVRAEVRSAIKAANVRRASENLKPLDVPGKETIRRHVHAAMCRDNFARKWGEKAAKSRWDGAGKGVSATKILAIGMMDDTVLDTVTVLDIDRGFVAGRPWLCVVMDVFSRCVLGWLVSYEPPTVNTAAECLRRANRPKLIRPDLHARYPVLAKINGRLDRLICDNGKNYASAQFQDILLDCGTTLQFTAVGSPTQKAIIERFFYTLKTWLLQKLPGYTHDIALIREFNLDPEKEAILTISELHLLIQEFVNSYHLQVHSGINMQPASKWEASMQTHGRDVIADERKLAILTGHVRRNRRLYRGAIRLLGLTFRDTVISARLNDDLVGAEPHRKRVSSGAAVATVKYKFNPSDLGEIYVWNHVSGEWVTLPCADQRYARGLSLWQHQQLRAWANKKNIAFNTEDERLEARRQLNNLIIELAPDTPARERRAAARMLSTSCATELQVDVVEAEPRHDGLSPVIEHETNEGRQDADIEPKRAGGGACEGPDPEDEAEAGERDEVDVGDDKLEIYPELPPVNGPINDDERFEEYE